MCGRYTLTTPPDAMADIFGIRERLNIPPRYNIAPTQDVPVIFRDREIDDDRHLGMMRWGLVPPWAKSLTDGPLLINARLDGIATKPSFKGAFRHRRCLVPADGFYEWTATGGAKQPYLIRPKADGLFVFAGIWSEWNGPDENPIRTLAIATTEADGAMTDLHSRLPVILEPDFHAAWLGETQAAPPLLQDPPRLKGDDLTFQPVSRRVNAVANDDPACLDPAEPEPEPQPEPPRQGSLF